LDGEELVVLGLGSDAGEARQLAKRLRRAVATTRTADGHSVTASIGIALVRPVDGEDAAGAVWRLIDRADGAMYEAKQAGREEVSAGLPRLGTGPLEDDPPIDADVDSHPVNFHGHGAGPAMDRWDGQDGVPGPVIGRCTPTPSTRWSCACGCRCRSGATSRCGWPWRRALTEEGVTYLGDRQCELLLIGA